MFPIDFLKMHAINYYFIRWILSGYREFLSVIFKNLKKLQLIFIFCPSTFCKFLHQCNSTFGAIIGHKQPLDPLLTCLIRNVIFPIGRVLIEKTSIYIEEVKESVSVLVSKSFISLGRACRQGRISSDPATVFIF